MHISRYLTHWPPPPPPQLPEKSRNAVLQLPKSSLSRMDAGRPFAGRPSSCASDADFAFVGFSVFDSAAGDFSAGGFASPPTGSSSLGGGTSSFSSWGRGPRRMTFPLLLQSQSYFSSTKYPSSFFLAARLLLGFINASDSERRLNSMFFRDSYKDLPDTLGFRRFPHSHGFQFFQIMKFVEIEHKKRDWTQIVDFRRNSHGMYPLFQKFKYEMQCIILHTIT